MTTDHSTREQMLDQVINVILESVNLRHVVRADLTADTSLRTGGLELDSVDMLEVIIAIEHQFGVKVEDAAAGEKHFRSLGAVADFILQQRAAPQP
ncbi:MAG TPA: phosphopantetheine-binding protein [Polyangiaceae bacterium]|nr:phosphopantetheine-binding protein [Polyangiaceae bacterium]